MRDFNGDVIEVGDKVTFPGPYGQTLIVGTAVKVGLGRQYSYQKHKVKVRMDKPEQYTGKVERDYWGHPTATIQGNAATLGILIIKKKA